MPSKYWREGVTAAIFILNRLSIQTLQGKIPYMKWTGQKPDVRFFRKFGCIAYAHISKATRKKLDTKFRECILAEYCDPTKGNGL